ncbi:hypothetical protein GGR54DRAFT_611414 [Hypoxylon sp. NC1633]|nr:hypothetical protein GGR54DRAFT_611414 [Hypoxylon sp. NC1633]
MVQWVVTFCFLVNTIQVMEMNWFLKNQYVAIYEFETKSPMGPSPMRQVQMGLLILLICTTHFAHGMCAKHLYDLTKEMMPRKFALPVVMMINLYWIYVFFFNA